VTLAVFRIGFCISRAVSWIVCCRGSSSKVALLRNLLLGIGSVEVAVYFRHTAQHHIPKDNADNLKSHKFNILFLLHTVKVYLNQIITKCGCAVGILALCLVAPRFRSKCGDGLSYQLFVQFSSVPPSSC
jgi:hypothetical protein